MGYDMTLPGNYCKGKIIRKITIEEYKIIVEFDEGTLTLEDHCSCCENRYFTCDDPVNYWEGLAFIGYRVERGPDIDDSTYGEHECCFLIFETFLGSFTVAAHNEHNGYYGGMDVTEEFAFKDGRVIKCSDAELPRELKPVQVPFRFLATTALVKWEFA